MIDYPLSSRLKFRTFLPDLYLSFPVSSYWSLTPKIALWCKLIIFPSPCFACRSLIVVVSYVIVYVSEKRAANIRRITIEFPMWAIRRAPADNDNQACCLCSTLCKIVIGHFDHGWYIVAIVDPGDVYVLRSWHRCDQEQLRWLYMNSGSQIKILFFSVKF